MLNLVLQSGCSEGYKQECKKLVAQMPNTDVYILSFEHFTPIGCTVYCLCRLRMYSRSEYQNSTNMKSMQKHIPLAYYVITLSVRLVKIYLFGIPRRKHFFQNLIKNALYIYDNYLNKVEPMNSLTPAEHESQEANAICHICEKFLSLEIRETGNCHLTDDYRRSAYNKCNLEYVLPNFVPIYFHYLSACECHLFIRKLSSIIPQA